VGEGARLRFRFWFAKGQGFNNVVKNKTASVEKQFEVFE
jgi:hypothetical protein